MRTTGKSGASAAHAPLVWANRPSIEHYVWVSAGIFGGFLLGLILLCCLLFGSLWLGFYLSGRLGDHHTGFILVSGVYCLCGLFLIIARKKLAHALTH